MRLVTVFTADRTLVLSQNGAQDAPHRVLDGVRSVDLLAGAVVFAEDAVLQRRNDKPLEVSRARSTYVFQRLFVGLELPSVASLPRVLIVSGRRWRLWIKDLLMHRMFQHKRAGCPAVNHRRAADVWSELFFDLQSPAVHLKLTPELFMRIELG